MTLLRAAMYGFDDIQLAMFSGKGGVGKTTFACGFARHWGRQWPQQRVLLLSTDPAHSLGDVLQVAVGNTPTALTDIANVQVRALDARALLEQFRQDYGELLEQLVERGSFVEDNDLSPVWDMGWPGLDELMALLEIERVLRLGEADRVVVDMAPSGHTLNLFALMDFLDTLLAALEQFQAKHRFMVRALSGRYTPDEADRFIQAMERDLAEGRSLLQDPKRTACWVVAIPEPLSLAESQRFIQALGELSIPVGGVVVNRLEPTGSREADRQQPILAAFQALVPQQPGLGLPLQPAEPVGSAALDRLIAQVQVLPSPPPAAPDLMAIAWPQPVPPGLADLIVAGRRLVLVGGKGGVGKTTVAAALSWGLSQRHPEAAIRVMSIDPAHSLGDAFERPLGHEPTVLQDQLSAQEVDGETVLADFRREYLWELAEMMAGDSGDQGGLQLAYGPEAWRQIVTQALPGIDELLSLIAVMALLEQQEQRLIVLDTAPTGHLLRFLEMPTALGDWLAWIFKLWIKYKDVVGRVELMGRLRSLRQRVMAAQQRLQDPNHTEFIQVVQPQTAVLAEAQRLSDRLQELGIHQRYVIHNRYQPGQELPPGSFPGKILVRLPGLPPQASPRTQIEAAARLLLQGDGAGRD